MSGNGRIEDLRLVRGAGRYTDDHRPEGALHGVFLRSPMAHARIRSVDAEAARAMPGVVAVFTGADLAAAGLGSIRPIVRRTGPDGQPMALPPRPPLTADVARFVGDPVALVVAESRATAEDAAEAVFVDYEDLEPVVDIEAAVADGAPAIWPEAPGNVAYAWEAGDRAATEAAIASAAHVTRLTVRVSRTTASPMEPRAAVAEIDRETGRLRLVAGVQAPWQARAILATQVLGIPPADLEVVSPDVGGSFGMKGQTFPEFGALLHAARTLGRPVRWLCTRSDGLVSDDHGRDVVMHGTLALDGDGRIAAVAMDGLTALGAYLSTRGTLTTVDNVPGICGPYRVPVAHAAMLGVYTNTASISPYRGAGRPEASLLIERLMDEAARETGRSPADLRRINLIAPDELPHRTPLGFTYDSGAFAETLDKALDLADVAGFAARKAASEAAGRLRGIGLAVVIARSANGQFEAARATLDGTGKVRVESGAVSHGQSHETVLATLAARAAGVSPEAIDWRTGSSDQFEAAVGTFGSRTAGIAGPAIEEAASRLGERMRTEAARQLNAEPAGVRFDGDGYVSDGGARITLSELAARQAEPMTEEARFAPEAPTYPNGSHVCEVEIDPETGTTEVVRYTVIEDVGTVLDPVVVKGQVHGGIAQGLGQAMYEHIAYDGATGQPLTGSFMDFAMPRASDLPSFAVDSHPVPTAANPLGVKGAGEGGTIGALPAFQNALADALAPLGLRDIPMPATPDVVWRMIAGARHGADT